VKSIRTISLTGLSDVKVQFTYDVSYPQASQMVVNRLSQLGPLPTPRSPSSRRPARSARSSAIAWSALPATPSPTSRRSRTGSCSAAEIGARRDRRHDWGGKSKTYDITVDLDRLLAYNLTLKQVLDALNGANINVGANT